MRSSTGEMSEWLKEHAWKVCIRFIPYRGFESLSLRHIAKTRRKARFCYVAEREFHSHPQQVDTGRPALRPTRHSRRECSLRLPAFAVTKLPGAILDSRTVGPSGSDGEAQGWGKQSLSINFFALPCAGAPSISRSVDGVKIHLMTRRSTTPNPHLPSGHRPRLGKDQGFRRARTPTNPSPPETRPAHCASCLLRQGDTPSVIVPARFPKSRREPYGAGNRD